MKRLAIVCGAALVCAALAFRDTILAPGVPAFRHDWSWPGLSTAFQYGAGVQSVWNPNGYGAPYVRIVNHPILHLLHLASYMLDAKSLLVLLVLACSVSIAAGTYTFARALCIAPAHAVAAALIATFGPPYFSKFIAGHYYYLIAMAALPWALVCGLCAAQVRQRATGYALLAGLLIALTSLQIQLWVIALLLTLVVFVAGSSALDRHTVRNAALMFAFGLILMLPAILGVAFAHSAQSAATQQTIPFYELNNSSPLKFAAIGMGYSPPYASNGYDALGRWGTLQVLLWIVPLGAVLAVSLNRARLVIAIFAAWLLLVLLVAGLYGPLGPLLSAMFGRFVWMSTFRELYHFAWPAWMLGSVLCAILLQRISVRVAVVCWIGVCGAVAALWIPRDYAAQLFSFTTPHQVENEQERIADAPGNSRYAILPGVDPVAPVGAARSIGGLDNDAVPIGDHPVANTQEPPPRLIAAFLIGERGEPRARAWLDAYGIFAAIDRNDLESRRNAIAPVSAAQTQWLDTIAGSNVRAKRAFAPNETPMAFAASNLPRTWDPFTTAFDEGFIWEGEYDPADFRYLHADSANWNAFKGWTRAGYWYWIDARVAFFPDALLTFSKTAYRFEDGDVGSYALVAASFDHIRVGNTFVAIRPRQLTWIPITAHTRTIGAASGFVEIVGVSRDPQTPKESSSQTITSLRYTADCVCVQADVPAGTRWIGVKEQYDGRWEVSGDVHVERHVLLSGYGNAWQIERTTRSVPVVVRYVPAIWWQPVADASLVLWWLVGCALAAWVAIQKFRRETS